MFILDFLCVCHFKYFSESVGENIIDGLRDLAQHVVDFSSDPRKDVTFGPANSSLMPGYRPAVVPTVEMANDNVVQSLPLPSRRTQHKREAFVAVFNLSVV